MPFKESSNPPLRITSVTTGAGVDDDDDGVLEGDGEGEEDDIAEDDIAEEEDIAKEDDIAEDSIRDDDDEPVIFMIEVKPTMVE